MNDQHNVDFLEGIAEGRAQAKAENERLQSLLANSEMTVEELLANDERLRAALQFTLRPVTSYSVVELDVHFSNARTALEGK